MLKSGLAIRRLSSKKDDALSDISKLKSQERIFPPHKQTRAKANEGLGPCK